jgi:hypothetical protein
VVTTESKHLSTCQHMTCLVLIVTVAFRKSQNETQLLYLVGHQTQSIHAIRLGDCRL